MLTCGSCRISGLLEMVNCKSVGYRVFSRDVTAPMLVSPTNPPRIELYYHANAFLCFGGKTGLLIT